jgi:hypothetical protein
MAEGNSRMDCACFNDHYVRREAGHFEDGTIAVLQASIILGL